MVALRTCVERSELKQWDALGELRSRCCELAEGLTTLRKELSRLEAKVDAGGQNTSRGISVLQRAIEVIHSEQREVRAAQRRESSPTYRDRPRQVQ